MIAHKLLLLLPLAFAAPAPTVDFATFSGLDATDFTTLGGCSISDVNFPLPSELILPSGERPSLFTVGRGVQNYTCEAGAWTSAGAVANLYDVSCLAQYIDVSVLSSVLPKVAYNVLAFPDTSGLPVALNHVFVTSEAGLSPVFASKTEHVLAKRVNGIAAATDPAVNVPWLSLAAVEGSLAKSVFRLSTVNGQPPSSVSSTIVRDLFSARWKATA